ncbi:MAG: hypothetical protein FWC70_04215 [Defluviitaleaceae bacterium]|nr:hypothetical protein [Defluviitaleaceae bacterium]
MKKILLLSISLLLVGCFASADDAGYSHGYYETAGFNATGDIIRITDSDFDEQIRQIQWNRQDFLGRVIRFEGTFLYSYWDGEAVYFVGRSSDGCCGFHGFEVALNEIPRFDDETWVEVTGILEEFYIEDAGRYFLRLNVIEMSEREN